MPKGCPLSHSGYDTSNGPGAPLIFEPSKRKRPEKHLCLPNTKFIWCDSSSSGRSTYRLATTCDNGRGETTSLAMRQGHIWNQVPVPGSECIQRATMCIAEAANAGGLEQPAVATLPHH